MAGSGRHNHGMRLLLLEDDAILGEGLRDYLRCEGHVVDWFTSLRDLQSVADCGAVVRELGLAIDMLILNAGIMALPEPEQINGIEKHFFVNHLGHFVLANQLLPQVLQAEPGERFRLQVARQPHDLEALTHYPG